MTGLRREYLDPRNTPLAIQTEQPSLMHATVGLHSFPFPPMPLPPKAAILDTLEWKGKLGGRPKELGLAQQYKGKGHERPQRVAQSRP